MSISFAEKSVPDADIELTQLKLKPKVQINRNNWNWISIDDAEIMALIDFSGIQKGKAWKNPSFSISATGPEDNQDVIAIIIPIKEFPIDEYLEFRLKRFESECTATYKPSDASKLIAKTYPKTVGQLMRKTGWTKSALRSEFLP